MDRECVIANREVFTANPAFREQFDMELELLQVCSLHRYIGVLVYQTLSGLVAAYRYRMCLCSSHCSRTRV